MEQVADVEQAIRRLITPPSIWPAYFDDHESEFNQLVNALDAIGDTCLAIGDYVLNDLGQREGEKSLRLYGILEAPVLQQNAIRRIHRPVRRRKDFPGR